MSPTAENTTVKAIIQRIKVSPSHRDLIRQITNWQAAILADLLINAQNKVSLFPLTQLRQLEVTRQLKGQVAPSSAPATSRSEPEEWPRAPGAGSDFMAPGTAHSSPFGPWTFTSGTPEMNRNALILSGASKAVFLLQRLRPGLDGNERLCGSLRNSNQLGWV